VIGSERMNAAAEDIVEVAEPLHVTVDYSDTGAETDGHFGGIDSHDASADYSDAAGCDTRYAAQKYSASAVDLFEIGGADLNRHSAGDFAHWFEEREVTAVVGYRFIGYAGDAALKQLTGELASRSQVQVGE